MMARCLGAVLLVTAARTAAISLDDCASYSATLDAARRTFCASGFCPASPNVTAKKDWPSQVTYMQAILLALAADSGCFNPSAAARDTLAWLDANQMPARGQLQASQTPTICSL